MISAAVVNQTISDGGRLRMPVPEKSSRQGPREMTIPATMAMPPSLGVAISCAFLPPGTSRACSWTASLRTAGVTSRVTTAAINPGTRICSQRISGILPPGRSPPHDPVATPPDHSRGAISC